MDETGIPRCATRNEAGGRCGLYRHSPLCHVQ